MKYTIELTDNQKKQMDFMLDMANKHMGFNRKLEIDIPLPINETSAYKKGFEDGKKYENAKDNLGYYNGYNKGLEDARQTLLNLLKTPSGEWANIFDTDSYYVEAIFRHYSVSEIANRINAYEEKKKAEKESIKVGDIIYSKMTDSKAIIISFDAWDNWNCIDTCGTGFAIDESKKEFWKKIGHFDEVEQLLDKLRGSENEENN